MAKGHAGWLLMYNIELRSKRMEKQWHHLTIGERKEHIRKSKQEVSAVASNNGVIATAEHFKRLNRKLSAMSDGEAVALLDKVFNEHECTLADAAFMKQITDLVEGVEL